ncbi:uncharacterized protein LOC143273398 isoform X3 [Peromyscus maniculatus bairdii]|uniref:uncharacterized protein LOC143273398 isoform X3 n=1 Tax=Peromyscus maniculatus bairdii TaxID=230844 RepID=UPI003FD010E3
MMSAIAEISVKVLKKTKNKTNKEKSTKKWHMTQLYDFGYLPEELHPRYQCTSVLVLKVALSTIAKLLSEVHPPHTHPSGFILAQGLRPGITAKELVTIIVQEWRLGDLVSWRSCQQTARHPKNFSQRFSKM